MKLKAAVAVLIVTLSRPALAQVDPCALTNAPNQVFRQPSSAGGYGCYLSENFGTYFVLKMGLEEFELRLAALRITTLQETTAEVRGLRKDMKMQVDKSGIGQLALDADEVDASKKK